MESGWGERGGCFDEMVEMEKVGGEGEMRWRKGEGRGVRTRERGRGQD